MSPSPHVSADRSLDEEHGWPQPPRSRPSVATAPPARRRAPRDFTWLALAVLGLALAAAALGWYLSLDRAAPSSELTVPNVVGMAEAGAVTRLTNAGFEVLAIERPGRAKPGHVFAQRPEPPATLARGGAVTIRVANGRKS